MTSDRGNVGSSGNVHSHLMSTVPSKSVGLNPNASEFQSSKSPVGGQEVNTWPGDLEVSVASPVQPVNTVYEYTNGNITKVDPPTVVSAGGGTIFSNNEVILPYAPQSTAIQPVSTISAPMDFASSSEGVTEISTVSSPQLVSNQQTVPETNNNITVITPHHSEEGHTCLDGTIPDDQLRSLLRTQLDYYFSRENLAHDAYLVSQMDPDHYVQIRIVAHFNQVKKLTTNMQLIVQVLRELPTVQVDEKGEKVRPNHNRCIVILREIPESTPLEQVRNLFSGKNCPPILDCKFAHNDSWYVTFDSDVNAQRAYQYLREDVQTFLGKPIMARIKAKTLVRSSTYYPRNGVKQNYEQVQYPPINTQMPQVHAVSQHQPATPSPIYPNYTTATAVQSLQTVQYVNTNAQQQFQFTPYHQVMTWPATMLNPSMAFYFNDYQAESVKLNANTPPRSFPNMPRNTQTRNPGKPNRIMNQTPQHDVPSIIPQAPPPPPQPNQSQTAITTRQVPPPLQPEPRVTPLPERYSTISSAPLTVPPSSHQQVETVTSSITTTGTSNYGHRRNDYSSSHHMTGQSSGHTTGHSSVHSTGSVSHPRSAPHSHANTSHSNSSTMAHSSHSPSSTMTGSRHMSEPLKDSSVSQPRPPAKGYTTRRRRQDNETDGAKQTKNSSTSGSIREPRPAQQFQLLQNSFPPLPGLNSSTASGDVQSESKLSDVVKGTNKPVTTKDMTTPSITKTTSPTPSTPPSTPKETQSTVLTPSTPSSSNTNNNNKNMVVPTDSSMYNENTLPTPPNSPPHRSPVMSLTGGAVTSTTATNVGSKPSVHHPKSDNKDSQSTASHAHNINLEPVKLSYAAMVRRTEGGAEPSVVNGDRSDSDSGQPSNSNRATNSSKTQNSTHSEQCQNNPNNTTATTTASTNISNSRNTPRDPPHGVRRFANRNNRNNFRREVDRPRVK